MGKFEELKKLIEASEADFTKFYDNSNKAAGTRVRNQMQALKNLAQEIRQDVSAKKSA
ncbi:MAG: histone H1 [Cytophagaceae bacterium]